MSKIGNSFHKIGKELKDGAVKLGKKIDKVVYNTLHDIEDYVDTINKKQVLDTIDKGWHVAIDVAKTIHPPIGTALDLADKAGHKVYKYVKIKKDKEKILKTLGSNILTQIESKQIKIESANKITDTNDHHTSILGEAVATGAEGAEGVS